jgi:hydroxyethylthiazole kinase-like uncharacterized protein yjeF
VAEDDAELDATVASWADAALLGPGLGTTGETRSLVERTLARFAGPVVIDADALNVFAGDVAALRGLLGGRPAVLTPHPAELARLVGSASPRCWTRASTPARRSPRGRRDGAAQGRPDGDRRARRRRRVSAAGTAALAVGGSGDVLGGVVATLLAQGAEPLESAACGAWVHGRAAELATSRVGAVRGTTLEDVLATLPAVWGMRTGGVRLPRARRAALTRRMTPPAPPPASPDRRSTPARRRALALCAAASRVASCGGAALDAGAPGARPRVGSRGGAREDRVVLTRFADVTGVAGVAAHGLRRLAERARVYDRLFDTWQPPVTRAEGFPAERITAMARIPRSTACGSARPARCCSTARASTSARAPSCPAWSTPSPSTGAIRRAARSSARAGSGRASRPPASRRRSRRPAPAGLAAARARRRSRRSTRSIPDCRASSGCCCATSRCAATR